MATFSFLPLAHSKVRDMLQEGIPYTQHSSLRTWLNSYWSNYHALGCHKLAVFIHRSMEERLKNRKNALQTLSGLLIKLWFLPRYVDQWVREQVKSLMYYSFCFRDLVGQEGGFSPRVTCTQFLKLIQINECLNLEVLSSIKLEQR